MNDTWLIPVRRRAVIILILSLSVALALALGVTWFWGAPRLVIVRGEVEATQVDLAINVPGRLQENSVRIGDHVRKGDRLLTLVNPALEAQLVQAMAASNIAEVEMQRLLMQARTENTEQQSKTWQRAREISEEAERNFNRPKQVPISARLQPTQNFGHSPRGFGGRQASATQSESAVTEDRQAKRDLAIARAAQAKAVVLELKKNLEELNVLAPFDGEVVQMNIDRGELANPGAALISIVDLSEVWVSANLREDLLAGFRMHESIKGKLPALGDKEVEFEITSVSPLEDFANDAARKNSDLGLKIFKIRAVPTKRTEELRPGMSVLFEVPTSS